ncbi:MAG: hypothetical protein JO328_10385 [Hyphomicrobiales bacterium]|nr:hypothetical protein [Hyphomicrobiales bacterium]MBV9426210.1 hypothetical protein [Bradyrhizobiaceae bacterium]
MQSSAAELFHTWHDFYVLVGTASATLVGLMFVAASIGGSVFNETHRIALQAFISPTVVNFAAALFISIGVMIPSQTSLSLGLLLTAGGVAGLIYSGRVWFYMFVRRRFQVDAIDRNFYATVPLLGYLLVLAAGILLLLGKGWSAEVIAAALVVLMFAGIRNAWDMTTWIMMRTPTSVELPAPSEQQQSQQ